MGYPLTSEAGRVTSWSGTTAPAETYRWFDVSVGLLKENKVTINYTADKLNVTGGGDTTSDRSKSGLRSATFSIDAEYPRASPRLGVSGMVTHSSGYAQHVRGWKLTINASPPELDITELNQSDVTLVPWRVFMPGRRIAWMAEYTALLDSAATLAFPGHVALGASAAITLKLLENSTDPTFAGNVVVTGIDDNLDIRGGGNMPTTIRCEGDGDLTASDGSSINNLWAAGVVGPPTWDANGDGTPDNTLLVTLASGKTRTGPAHWTSVVIDATVAEIIKVSISGRFDGAVT